MATLPPPAPDCVAIHAGNEKNRCDAAQCGQEHERYLKDGVGDAVGCRAALTILIAWCDSGAGREGGK